jgi:hypothetical protein
VIKPVKVDRYCIIAGNVKSDPQFSFPRFPTRWKLEISRLQIFAPFIFSDSFTLRPGQFSLLDIHSVAMYLKDNMFNLEQSIAKWRRQMLAAGIKPPVPLDELESHLREDIHVLLSAGEPEPRAFELAVSRLGSPGSVQTEFKKIGSAPIWTVKIGSVLWLGAVIVLAALLLRGLFAGKRNLLMCAHILGMTAGYGAAFLIGSFGVYYVCLRWSHKLSPVRQRSLGDAIYLFSHLALGLVIVGMLLGIPLSKQYFGRYWRWDPKEIGALGVSVWLIALAATQRFGQISDRAAMLLCVGGNVVVSLAWFGAGIMDYNRRMHGLGNYWPLAIFLGIQFCFLTMGMVPARERAES